MSENVTTTESAAVETSIENQSVEQAQQTQQAQNEPEVAETPDFTEMSEEEQEDYLRDAFFDDIEDENHTDNAEGASEEGNTASSEGKEKEASKEENENEEETPETEYTAEQFLALDPLRVDGKRLPAAAKIVHEKYMNYYNSQIAPALKELNELRAFRDKVANGNLQGNEQPVSKPEEASNNNEDFNKAVMAEAARRLGVDEIDDWDSSHMATVAQVATEMTMRNAEINAKMNQEKSKLKQNYDNLNTATMEMEKEFGADFAVIDKWAVQEMGNLPMKTANKIMEDLRTGDTEKIKDVFRLFAKRYKEQKASKEKLRKDPPSLISGSGNQNAPRVSWGTKEFSKATPQEQARMLLEGGYV